jgi:predicted GIY-YIG superfamily endonuclease
MRKVSSNIKLESSNINNHKTIQSSSDSESYIYILELEQNKIYVGMTNNPQRRIQEHIEGIGADWTKKYKYVRTISIEPMQDEFSEDLTVKKLMKQYGMDNVRGGSYCKIKLLSDQISVLTRELFHSDGLCMNCGGSDHFVKNCPYQDSSNLTCSTNKNLVSSPKRCNNPSSPKRYNPTSPKRNNPVPSSKNCKSPKRLDVAQNKALSPKRLDVAQKKASSPKRLDVAQKKPLSPKIYDVIPLPKKCTQVSSPKRSDVTPLPKKCNQAFSPKIYDVVPLTNKFTQVSSPKRYNQVSSPKILSSIFSPKKYASPNPSSPSRCIIPLLPNNYNSSASNSPVKIPNSLLKIPPSNTILASTNKLTSPPSSPKRGNHCFRCGRSGHTQYECYAKTTINGTRLVVCNRCGRDGHTELQCYAKTSIDGGVIQ